MENYLQLAEFARTMKGKLMITVSECDEMRDVFGEFNIKSVDIKYTLNRKKVHKKSSELVVINY